jgi:hypothetical protein
MTDYDLDVTKLSCIPNIKMLLLHAALKKSSFHSQKSINISLPRQKFYFDEFLTSESATRRYHQVVGWDHNSEFVHPCYLHSVAFPLHIKLLLLPEFLFPLLGLVHVNNQIRQFRPIKKTEKLAVSSCFGELKLHPKGWLFSINVEFYSGSDLVWQSVSTNFFRTNHDHFVEPLIKCSMDAFTNPINTNWELSPSLGRYYAKVSGDFNPIHLTKWSAKLFGFKQHIIHGMWTKSYCISALQKISPLLFIQAFEIKTTFKQCLYLPSKVYMSVQSFESDSVQDKQHFKVVAIGVNNGPTPVYLNGSIRSI